MSKKLGTKFSNDSEKKSVFLAGISKKATEDIVKEKLEKFGDIQSVRFCINKDSGIFKCSGFANFMTKEGALKCLENHKDPAFNSNFMINGQFMKCLKPLPRKSPQPVENNYTEKEHDDKINNDLAQQGDLENTRKGKKLRSQLDDSEERSVFLLSISKEATEDIVREKLEKFGEIKSVRFIINKETGLFKCNGFAEFLTKEGALQCLQNHKDPANKNDFMINGQFMKCLKPLSKKKQLSVKNRDPEKKVRDKRKAPKRDVETARQTKKFEPKLNNDVSEERSVFLVGISKVATEDIVKEKLEKFGNIKNVKFCKSKDNGIFTSNGFAEFMTKEGALECLENNNDPVCKNNFMIDGQFIKCFKALSQNNVRHVEKSDPNRKVKDKRNIYLAREGVVREGAKAADGVSKHDLAVRLNRERLKHKLLKNLNCFVSPTRLFICNIPEKMSDTKLKHMFEQHSPKDAIIDECRLMKDLKNVSSDGVSKCKGYAFINFTLHDHALAALREINNNPDIFTNIKRPIVEFSIENKAALNAKLKRQQKSKTNLIKLESKGNIAQIENMNESKFVGGLAKPGMKLATHFGMKKNKKGKISRNKINNRTRKDRKVLKKRIRKKKERNNKSKK